MRMVSDSELQGSVNIPLTRLFWMLFLLLAGIHAVASEAPDILPQCEACHGEAGVSVNPQVPTLAGQPYTLIEDNLLAFRAGKRACSTARDAESPIALLARAMCVQVATLEDREIAALSEYFSGKPFIPARQAFDADAAARGSHLHVQKGCEHCHADGGQQTQEMAPVLAGQWSPYLRHAMNAFRSGSRKGPVVMNNAARTLSDQDIEALLQFYASQPESLRGASNP